MLIKVLLTVIFLAVMIGVGLYTRKQASSVEGFVLGGRAVGPWLTAFAFGTSYFSAPIPNPQSPIPNPQSPIPNVK